MAERPSLVEIAKCDLPIRHYIMALEEQLAAAREQTHIVDAKVIDTLERRLREAEQRAERYKAALEGVIVALTDAAILLTPPRSVEGAAEAYRLVAHALAEARAALAEPQE